MPTSLTRGVKWLTTTQVAIHLHLSEETVRGLCAAGSLPGAVQDRPGSPWRIPEGAVKAYQRTHQPTRTRVNKSAKTLSALFAILLAVVSAFADVGGARTQLVAWWKDLTFPHERAGETLILIATFERTEGVADAAPHDEIARSIRIEAKDCGLERLTVAVHPTRLDPDDRAAAERLGRRYNASLVIWGGVTAVRTTVSFLNLRAPETDASEVRISDTANNLLANPDAFVQFITRDVPGQMAFCVLFAAGQACETRKEYDLAARVIEQGIKALPDNIIYPEAAAAHFLLGWLYQIHLADLDHAITNYNQAVTLQPNLAKAYNNRGVIYGAKGKLDRAIEDCDRAIALQPNLAMAYSNRGNAYLFKDDFNHAIADYDQAVAIQPDCAQFYVNRCFAYNAKGEFDHAIEDCNRAITLQPDLATAYSGRGSVYLSQRDADHAITDYNQAIALQPGDALTYNNRGNAFRQKGEIDHAMADYTQAIALQPNNALIYYNRGLAYIQRGEYDRAIADLDQAIILQPDYSEAYNSRAVAYTAKGDLDHALTDYTQAIAIQPDYARAYDNRGTAHTLKGNLDLAIADYRQALILTSDPIQRAEIEARLRELGATP